MLCEGAERSSETNNSLARKEKGCQLGLSDRRLLPDEMSRILTLLTFLLQLLPYSQAYESSLPISGSCQSRCLKEYGSRKEVLNNLEETVAFLEIFNNTNFSLCKLGCKSPGVNDLPLGPFLFGQTAYNTLVTNFPDIPLRDEYVRSVSFLCAENSTGFVPNDTIKMTGKVFIDLLPGTAKLNLVHNMEIVVHDTEIPSDESIPTILYQTWCYSTTCNFSLEYVLPEKNFTERKEAFQIRLFTFDESGPTGKIVLSRWYTYEQLVYVANVQFLPMEKKWLDDKASVLFFVKTPSQFEIPACRLFVSYRNIFAPRSIHFPYQMDSSKALILKNLDFDQEYTLKLDYSNATDRLAKFRQSETHFNVPQCMHMINDSTKCAPPAIPKMSAVWNSSVPDVNVVLLTWTYYAFDEKDKRESDEVIAYSLAISHFEITLIPLISSVSLHCEKVDPIRRDVPWTQRKSAIYVSTSDCDYIAEIRAVDIKRRKSSDLKIHLHRYYEEYRFFSASNIFYSPLLLAFMVFALLALLCLAALIFFSTLKRRRPFTNLPKNVKVSCDSNNPKDVTRTEVIAQSEYSPAWPQLPVCHGLVNMSDGLAKLPVSAAVYHEYKNTDREERYKWRENPEKNTDEDEEDGYETIDELNDSRESEKSAYRPHFYRIPSPDDLNTFLVLPKFAALAEFEPMYSEPVEELKVTKNAEDDISPFWRYVKVEGSNLNSHELKCGFGSAASAELRTELCALLSFQRANRRHENIMYLRGVATSSVGDFEGKNIIGMLFEQCPGGTLRRFLRRAGTSLRRIAQTTHYTSATPIVHGTLQKKSNLAPSPPSSGYNSSNQGSGANTPDSYIERSVHVLSTRLCQFGASIISAIEYLHSHGVLHRHITCNNIQLTRGYIETLEIPCDQKVKLADFGWACVPNSCRPAMPVERSVAPPEVMAGKEYESRGDIWQFGICLLEMGTLSVSSEFHRHYLPSGSDLFDKSMGAKFLIETSQKCVVFRGRPNATAVKEHFKKTSARSRLTASAQETSI
ncbi:unnamed protein product [Caenorhabditis auriculariae]|uniref:Protein kinase domain-containing protein n=1 Tax=Caenorhabditis auriculariae TaxID=2777116 RepID=A0A8S1GXB4_9PELO|nr:unnamed protein product [Caenorhabditis auriculariae]